jgi:1-deoxy-D-xylulose-5-phosphate synthase
MLLDEIHNPQELKKLSLPQLGVLCGELRQRIVEVVSRTGGHLASSLGAVELIVALHYCIDAPTDKIIFDVGHQAYAHKLLTGRNRNFASLRQYGGLSGFPSQDESVYDSFTTGHSSNAVSLGLGLACARDIASEHFRVAAVIGDGSLSGGLCFEGLNNAGHLKKDILVILNTNELSIAPNAGALSTYLNKIISLPVYNHFKTSLENFLRSRLGREARLLKLANRFEEGLKGLFIPGVFFEELGFRYFGPLDGHDLNILVPTLKNILGIKGPRMLHVVTKKGKGYLPAEKDPVRFHGIGPFEIADGREPQRQDAVSRTYTGAFGEKLLALAEANPRIVAVTAAMPEGTGLARFAQAFAQRFFDVGIAEGHAVSFSGALAKGGLKAVVAIYSTFLQRAYDQLMQDVALQAVPIVLAVDRAGIVGEDGMTHQGLFDLAFLRTIPGLVIMAPSDAEELEEMLEFAVNLNQPAAIRYPKAASPNRTLLPREPLKLGKAEFLKEGKDFVLISLGALLSSAWEALELLSQEGLSGSLINARFARPLDSGLFKQAALQARVIFTLEEGIIEGGFGSAVAEAIERPVVRLGLPNEFIGQGKREFLLDKYGLSPRGLRETIRRSLRSADKHG